MDGTCDAFRGEGLKPPTAIVNANGFLPFLIPHYWRFTNLTCRFCLGLGDDVPFGLCLFVIEPAFATRAPILISLADTCW